MSADPGEVSVFRVPTGAFGVFKVSILLNANSIISGEH